MPQLTAAQRLRDHATRALIAARVPGAAPLLQFRDSQITTLASLAPLYGRGLVPPPMEDAVFRDRGGQNPLDDEEAWDSFFQHVRPRSVDDMAAAMEQIVWPSHQARSTRDAHQRMWSLVISWSLAHMGLSEVLPMSRRSLLAITWDLLAQGCSATYVTTVWAAIRDRHAWAGCAFPLAQEQLQEIHKAISKCRGRAAPLKCPVMKDHVQAVLRIRSLNFVINRDRLLTAVATVCALRSSEVVGLQACDLWFEYDAKGATCPARFKNTILVYIRRRKNDQLRRGHGPRIGCAADPDLCITTQLRAYMHLFQLLPKPGCTRMRGLSDQTAPDSRLAAGASTRIDPSVRCRLCPPLFPKSVSSHGAIVASHTAMPRQMVTDCIRGALRQIGVDASQFSSVSARKGGISVASLAGVPEWAVCLQSGHAQNPANRAYINACASAYMYATWAAFDL